MTDKVTQEKRSWIMSRIGSFNTQPELIVNDIISKFKIKYNRNDRSLPGSPDFSFPRKKAAIFVHGCFWHGHIKCGKSRTPKSNADYWKNKIINNRRRDRKAKLKLTRMNWTYLTLWECELKNPSKVKFKIARFLET